jgi:hypothetical protein
MVWILVKFNDRCERVEVDVNEGVSTLRFQLYSLFDVPPEQQSISGLLASTATAVLKDSDDLSTMDIKTVSHVVRLQSSSLVNVQTNRIKSSL